MGHLDGDRPLQLVVVGQIDDAEAALSQDSFHPVATDVLRRRSGSFIRRDRPVRACSVGVVHGQSSSSPVLRRHGGL